ncbi:rod shape-determining protein RodA [Candidatus Falkowbacteria bacterium]|nr:MAG: rod shape-determining protein RodA [Candidatus Falkowbacteria bacterium]
MLKKLFFLFKQIDWFLLGPIIVLVCFSLVEIYSISLGQTGADLVFFRKQVAFVIVGIILYLVLSAFDFHHFFSYSNYLYIGGILLLVLVLIFGETINGTRGWFYIFGFGLQPVELVKIILIISLARYFSKESVTIRPLRHFIISAATMAFCAVLVLLQPDFGSAALLFAIWLVFVAGVGFEKKYLLFIGIGLVIVFALAWQFVFKDYQRDRLLSFLQPSATSTHYNVRQAIIAVGAGGLYGRGLGFGSQSQLKFLPEANTDFIFAVIAEELGLIGVLMVIGCFALILYRLILYLPHIRNYFGSLIIIGGVGLIFIEMFINIGMNIGILPVVGIPLPFVSYGGSALLAHMGLAGIMQNIISRSAAKR